MVGRQWLGAVGLAMWLAALAACSREAAHEAHDRPRSRPMTFERLVGAESDADNWLTYSRTYDGRRFSPLQGINRQNVGDLQLQWVYPLTTDEPVETTPLVIDGVMYLTRPVNVVAALDAVTGKQ